MIRSIQLAEQPSRNNNTKKNNDRVFNKKFIIKKADIRHILSIKVMRLHSTMCTGVPVNPEVGSIDIINNIKI